MTMKPPPPRFPAPGYVTASAKPTATAASTALPPRCRISTPALDASASADATIPWRARTGSRDAPCTETSAPQTVAIHARVTPARRARDRRRGTAADLIIGRGTGGLDGRYDW